MAASSPDILFLVNILEAFLPIAILLAYFLVENKLAHSIAGMIASGFLIGSYWITKNSDIGYLGTELFVIFIIGSIFSLLFQGWRSVFPRQAGGGGAAGGGGGGGTTRTNAATGSAGGPARPGDGIIAGTVVDATTGAPIHGLVVRVRGTGITSPPTGTDGRFSVEVPKARVRGYSLTFDHPDYVAARRGGFYFGRIGVDANDRVDLGTIRLHRRTPIISNPVTPVLLDGLGNPRINNLVFPGDRVVILFRLATGLRTAVPLGITGGNPDRFVLQDDTGREIGRFNIPNNPANYPRPDEVRIPVRVPTTYPGPRGAALPFRDISIRIIPRIQFV